MTDEAPTRELLDEGRSLARVNLWRIFWVSAFVTWLGAQASNQALVGALRIVMIGLMCVLVYRGFRWALWLLGALTVLAGVLMVGVAVGKAGLEPLDRALFAVGGAVQVAAFVILLRAPAVSAFMRSQRDRS